MSDTPRTDQNRIGVFGGCEVVHVDFARQLERELANAVAVAKGLSTRVELLLAERDKQDARVKEIQHQFDTAHEECETVDIVRARFQADLARMSAALAARDARIKELELGCETWMYAHGKMGDEREQARRFGEEAARKYNELLADQRILRCAFCDAEYPPDTPPSQHDALTAHVAVCPSHPMRAVEAERDAALADARRMTDANRKRIDIAERVIDEYVDEYEFTDGDNGYYIPTEKERALLEDFAHGLMVEIDAAMQERDK